MSNDKKYIHFSVRAYALFFASALLFLACLVPNFISASEPLRSSQYDFVARDVDSLSAEELDRVQYGDLLSQELRCGDHVTLVYQVDAEAKAYVPQHKEHRRSGKALFIANIPQVEGYRFVGYFIEEGNCDLSSSCQDEGDGDDGATLPTSSETILPTAISDDPPVPTSSETITPTAI